MLTLAEEIIIFRAMMGQSLERSRWNDHDAIILVKDEATGTIR